VKVFCLIMVYLFPIQREPLFLQTWQYLDL